MATAKNVILYHYSYSPFARRIVWYLNLRKIPYTQCMQPPIMPRPDVKALGMEYRRIPLLAIGRDIYNDTRLILQKLEMHFPASDAHPPLSTSSPDMRAVERLLDCWVIDGGLFNRASQLIPTSMPLLNDNKFTKDREDYSGRSWSKSSIEAMRPEALVEIQNAFAFLEETLLADGREWILNTKQPSLADINSIWPFHWLQGLKGALPPDLFSVQQYPKVFAWVNRFHKITAAAKAVAQTGTIEGQEAISQIGSSDYAEKEGQVNPSDPTGLKKGQEVEVWPIDTGSSKKDKGPLVSLSSSEIVIESKTDQGKSVRIHSPRHGFRVKAVGGQSSKL